MATSLRKIKILYPLFAFRDAVMDKTGLFQLKRKIKQRLLLKRLVYEDTQLKKEINKKILAFPDGLITNNITHEDIIISLTSYGKRVEDALPYALYSLLTQTILPKKIVVYLDRDNWSDDRLPDLIKHLKKIGIEVRYCEDIRSYKKIVPALRDFPNNPIVTVDDDIYYNEHMIEWLLDAYKNLPEKSVVGLWACIVASKDGKYMPYNTWKDCKYRTSESEFALYTGYGTLYPPHIFDSEVMNSDIFMSLCPTADDIWMWAMEKRLNIPVYITENACLGLHTDVNRKNMLFPEDNPDSLYYVNELMGNKNDEQFNNLISYYHLSPSK
jgi:hypothetical protein